MQEGLDIFSSLLFLPLSFSLSLLLSPSLLSSHHLSSSPLSSFPLVLSPSPPPPPLSSPLLQSVLTKQQNDFKIKLKELEDSLLHRLSSAEGNILSDTALVDNLETTKRTAATIAEQVEEAKKTEVQINMARELYRPAATRAAMLYFILNDLNKINPLYQFSLKVCHHS